MIMLNALHHMINNGEFDSKAYWLILIGFFWILTLILHYFLAKKYKLAAQTFSMVQTILLMICMTEIFSMINSPKERLNQFSGRGQTAFLASLSLLAFN
jgi:hypothetical protein